MRGCTIERLRERGLHLGFKSPNSPLVELNQEVKEFICQNYGDINTSVRNQIEVTINYLK